jgi:hypothetical protein
MNKQEALDKLNFLIRFFKEFLPCKHEGNFRELMSCQAVCCDCNKEIGFIGTVRLQARGTNRKEIGQQSWK